MKKFTLVIDASRLTHTHSELAEALENVAAKIETHHQEVGFIRNRNGKGVGFFEMTETETPEEEGFTCAPWSEELR